MTKKIIAFCMTSDFAFDQRMQRIAGTLSKENIGIIIHRSKQTKAVDTTLKLVDVQSSFKKGIFFYLFFNLKLFKKLIDINPDVIYTADTDTLLATGMYKWLKSKINIYDSHEYFTEVPELKDKPFKKKIWLWVENTFVPKCDLCLTVGPCLARIFSEKFKKPFYTVRNLPYSGSQMKRSSKEKIILYQGAINEGRGLHCAIDAMAYLDEYKLIIIGQGDISSALKKYAADKPYAKIVEFKDALLPEELKTWTCKAMFGLNLIENTSLNYYYSLANKFFDYLQAEVPSINMKYPEYENILIEKPFGIMINELNAKELAEAIIANSSEMNYQKLVENCSINKSSFIWEIEEQKLLSHFNSLIK